MNNSRNSHYKLSDLFRHRVKWSDLSKSEKFSLIFGTCLRLIVFLASLAFVICLWSFVRESRVSSDYAYAEWVDSTNGTYDGSWSTSQSYYLSPDSDQFVPLVGGFSSSFG